MSDTDMLVLLHEQLLDYSGQLKAVEKELIRKYKLGEDYQNELTQATGLKALKIETVKMMTNYGGRHD